MFNGAHRFVINGCTFQDNSRSVFSNDAIVTGQQQLLKYIASCATHDSSERFPAPRCHQETRKAVNSFIIEWISNLDHEKNVLWLHGPAGAGKSCIAQTIAEQCSIAGHLAASFFFSRTSPGRNTAERLFSTLSYQLSVNAPETSQIIFNTIAADPTIFHKSLDTQFQKLILEPLLAVKPLVQRPLCIIIDGLDECRDENVQIRILFIIIQAVENYQLGVSFFIASRPEPQICDEFNSEPFLHLTLQFSLGDEPSADNDIRLFLEAGFTAVLDRQRHRHTMRAVQRPWPRKNEIEELVRKSSGQFIYAAVVLKFVDDPHRRPTTQLETIMKNSPSSSPAAFSELDQLYVQILSAVHDKERMHEVLGMVIVLLDSLSEHQYNIDDLYEGQPQPSFFRLIEQLCNLEPGDTYLALRGLQSLLYLPDQWDEDELYPQIKVFHASFRDFLIDPQRSLDYYIDVSTVHTRITHACLKIMASPKTLETDEYLGWCHSIMSWTHHCLNSTASNELFEALRNFDVTSHWIDVLIDDPFCPRTCSSHIRDVRWPWTLTSRRHRWDGMNSLLCWLQLLPCRDSIEDIIDYFIYSIDAVFLRYLDEYSDYRKVVRLLALIVLRMPYAFSDMVYLYPYHQFLTDLGILLDCDWEPQLQGLFMPLENIFPRDNGFFELFWSFLNDYERAGKYYLHSQVHSEIASDLLGVVTLVKESPIDKIKYTDSWASNLGRALPTHDLLSRLVIATDVYKHSFEMQKLVKINHISQIVSWLKRFPDPPSHLIDVWNKLPSSYCRCCQKLIGSSDTRFGLMKTIPYGLWCICCIIIRRWYFGETGEYTSPWSTVRKSQSAEKSSFVWCCCGRMKLGHYHDTYGSFQDSPSFYVFRLNLLIADALFVVSHYIWLIFHSDRDSSSAD